jgi:hypothetical protein
MLKNGQFYVVPPKRGHPYQRKKRTPEEILEEAQRKRNEMVAKQAVEKEAKKKAANEEQEELDARMEEAIAGRAPFPRFQTGLSKRSTALVGPPERHMTEDNIRTQLNIEKLRAERAAEEAGGAAGGVGEARAGGGEENENVNSKPLAGFGPQNKEFLNAMAAASDPFGETAGGLSEARAGGAAGGQGGGARRRTKRRMRKTRKHKTRGRN